MSLLLPSIFCIFENYFYNVVRPAYQILGGYRTGISELH